MDKNLKREIILENYEKPINKGLKNDKNYLKIKKSSSTCIDSFDIELKMNNNTIEDIRFDGEACAISTSAISISIGNLIGKSKKEALEIINNYLNMINEKQYDKEKLKELIVYEDIYKQPARKKCATIGILGIKELLEK